MFEILSLYISWDFSFVNLRNGIKFHSVSARNCNKCILLISRVTDLSETYQISVLSKTFSMLVMLSPHPTPPHPEWTTKEAFMKIKGTNPHANLPSTGLRVCTRITTSVNKASNKLWLALKSWVYVTGRYVRVFCPVTELRPLDCKGQRLTKCLVIGGQST